MSDYDGLDFAVGSIRGFRRWKVDMQGALLPVAHSGRWLPGENVAKCKCTPKSGVHAAYDDSVGWKAKDEVAAEWRKTAPFEDMQCGFYAYFDGNDEYGHGASSPNISGVIEAYGEVLIGSKGFRAKKARILALSVAPFDGFWRLDDFVVNKIRANYPGVPIFDSELAMRAEFDAPHYSTELVAP